jgi:hypothetical protein
VDFYLQLLSEHVRLKKLGEDLTVGEYFSSREAFLTYRRNREATLVRTRFPHIHRLWCYSNIVVAGPDKLEISLDKKGEGHVSLT